MHLNKDNIISANLDLIIVTFLSKSRLQYKKCSNFYR